MTVPAERRLVITGVPIDCVSAPAADSAAFGTELAPGALREAGLAAVVGAADAGDLPVRLVGRARDPGTGIVGWPSVQDLTSAVRFQAREILAGGGIPVMVGGCCTLLPGALAGARDCLGRLGLAYVDGHLDTYDGQTSPTGEAADMPVSVISGHGPEAWSRHVGAPLVGPGQLTLLGPRDRAEAATLGSALPEDCGLDAELGPAQLRAQGMAAAGRGAAGRLARRAGRYWLHLDVDVLSEDVFPATDYLMPGGLDLAELRELIEPLVARPELAGMSLGCYNPSKDADGSGAEALVRLFRGLLS
ncbi:MAG TPA: arginase family protein [Streptosporangiaceae bacterium]|nr:arginase family protein [Streptosporangiaceae bacterium]